MTVSVALAARLTLTGDAVEVPARMLMPLQAGTIVVGVLAALTLGTAIVSAPRSATTAVEERRQLGARSDIRHEPSPRPDVRAVPQRSHNHPGPHQTTHWTTQDSVSYLRRTTPDPNTRVSSSRVRERERREEWKPGPEHDRMHVGPDLIHQTGANERTGERGPTDVHLETRLTT